MSLWLPVSEGRPKGKEEGRVGRAKLLSATYSIVEELPLSVTSANDLRKIS